MRFQRLGILASSGAMIAYTLSLSHPPEAIAQIVPDNSLGSERSIVTPSVQNPGGLIDRIDGGAIRGNNLFHSFQDFNVGNRQRVYFTNPSGIANILGRVTGNQPSNIFGKLGVLGSANLYLINPNGIIFGKDAQLDVSGSFFGTTSRSLLLENYQFGTQNPEAPPLLTINFRPGLDSWLPPQNAIANSGNLSVGQDLTLVGTNLDLQGQLQAGGNLTLQATDTLKVRESNNDPFRASAGGQVIVEGNQIDLLALNHPTSGFFAGEDMVLRSDNPVAGNIQLSTDGNLIVRTTNGAGGNLVSFDDPIIRASGDVSFNSYTGASIHIFAGGSVTIDSLNITNPDTTSFINETVTLADGVTQLLINGSLKPTVDIRAGTTAFNPPGISGNSSGFSSLPNTGGNPTSANININQIKNQGGLVFLTNQYQPNSALSGDIKVTSALDTSSATGGGNVVIDSRGKITTPNVLNTSGIDFRAATPPAVGGDIKLLAQNDIFMPVGSQIFSYGSVGGNITLKSQTAIIQEQAPLGSSFIESASFGAGQGGDVTLNAPFIFLSNYVQSNVRSRATASGGKLIITAKTLEANQADLSNVTRGGNAGDVIVNAEAISLNNSKLGSQTISTNGGNAGNVEINTKTFVATNGGQVFSQTERLGNAGKITVNAQDAINLTGTSPTGRFSGFSNIVFPNAQGNGGIIQIKTGSLSLQQGAQIRATTLGQGDAGRIEVDAAKSIMIDGAILLAIANRPQPTLIPSGIISEVLPGSRGHGNVIDIKTGQLAVRNGAGISASTVASGNAGDIFINASESVSFDGNPGEPFKPSGAFVGTLQGATGKGGTLQITTPSLSVTNGAQLEALTESRADAGNIIVKATNRVFLSGANTGLFSNTTAGSTGNGGYIFVDPELVEIRDGAAISVDSQGSGIGGNIEIQADELRLDNQGLISAETASTDGGNITLQLADLLLLRRGSRISTTAGNARAGGDGGIITINTNFIAAVPQENSDISANAFFGSGGNIDITATGLFGISFQVRPTTRSDITASSEFGVSGTVSINDPQVDPNSGLVELPANLSDANDRVAAACASAEGNSFTVTGRGGLPADPTATIRPQTLLSDMRDFTTTQSSNQVNNSASIPQARQQIVAATDWIINAKGEVELVASLPQEGGQKTFNCSDLQGLKQRIKK
ncbi:hypothetical protein NIES4074_23080 [Cylindrospermum sp. NIES-4074]|nr:hypothetical protein NIES4074_23080 [Cylindrospermum sp. NIES-4074]